MVSNIVTRIFAALATIVSVYSTLCFIRIILTWIPQLSYSKFTQILSKITDPYLNFFRRFRFLVIGSFDFSPAIALCVLGIFGYIFQSLSHGGTVSLGIILAMLIQSVWSIIASILVFIIILLVIRLIVLLVNHNQSSSYGSVMDQLDRTLYKIVYNVVRPFVGKNRITYKTALIATIIILILVNVAGSILFNTLANLVANALPPQIAG